METEKLISTVLTAQNGDNDALNLLFNEYYNDLYYFALKTLKDSDLAADITQDAFIDIIKGIGSLKEPSSFLGWAKKITYHRCTAYFKKKKDILVDEDEKGNTIFDALKEESSEFIPHEALDKEDFKKTVMEIIDELSEEQRATVLMFYYDEMPVGEIAEIQGISVGTVKSRLNYARKAIKKSVEEYEKKHHIKLYAIPMLPLFKWLLEGIFKSEMPSRAALKMANNVSAATGVKLTGKALSATKVTEVAKVAEATPVAGTDKAGTALSTGGKVGAGLGTKAIAVIAAAIVTIGGIVGGIALFGPEDNPKDNNKDKYKNEKTSSEALDMSSMETTSIINSGSESAITPGRDYYPSLAGGVYSEYLKTVTTDMNNTGYARYIPISTAEALQKYEILGYDTSKVKIIVGMITELNGFAKVSYQISFTLPDREAALQLAKQDISIFNNFLRDEVLKRGVESLPEFSEEDYLRCFEKHGLSIKYDDSEVNLENDYDMGMHAIRIWAAPLKDGGYSYDVNLRLALPYSEMDYTLYCKAD